MKKILFFILFYTFGFNSLSFARDTTFYFTTSDKVRLFVKLAGEGSPCVFVHGGPGSNSYYYEAMLSAPLIEKKIQMIYFDQRGCGRSDSASNHDYSLARMEKDLEELRTFLGYKTWDVMGHSFGGIIVTQYAYDYPASVRRLLLIHCTLNIKYSMNSHLEFGLKELNITDQTRYRDTSVPLIERVGMVHEKLTEKGVWYKLMYRNSFEKKLNDTIDHVLSIKNREFANNVWGLNEYFRDLTPLCKKIKCPVLIMTGEKDFAIGPDHYRQFGFPNKTIIKYIGGHAPFQEEPQWYAEKILDFLLR